MFGIFFENKKYAEKWQKMKILVIMWGNGQIKILITSGESDKNEANEG